VPVAEPVTEVPFPLGLVVVAAGSLALGAEPDDASLLVAVVGPGFDAPAFGSAGGLATSVACGEEAAVPLDPVFAAVDAPAELPVEDVVAVGSAPVAAPAVDEVPLEPLACGVGVLVLPVPPLAAVDVSGAGP